MTKILRAAEVNQSLVSGFQAQLQGLRKEGVVPELATIRIGEDPASLSYERSLIRKLGPLGMAVQPMMVGEEEGEGAALAKIGALADDPGIHGILLFQPLPEGFEASRLTQAIPPEKDVDGAGWRSQASLFQGEEGGFSSCSPEAVIRLLDYYGIGVRDKTVVILGSGLVVARPLAMLLLNRHASVFLTNSKTQNIREWSQQADILVSAVGRAGLVDASFIRPGQVLIDVGTSYQGGRLCGDIDREAVEGIAGAMTPTPGGIGGITTTLLASHLVQAACLQQGK